MQGPAGARLNVRSTMRKARATIRPSFLREPGVLINRTSLSQTVDAINAAHFDGRTLAAAERGQARTVDQPDATGLPAGLRRHIRRISLRALQGIVLFTGERIASASARHILGEEASRALRQLRVQDPNVTRALEGADSGLMRCLERAAEDPRNGNPGLLLLRQMQCGLVAKLARRRPGSTRRAIATRRLASADRCATANINGGDFPSGTRCWP